MSKQVHANDWTAEGPVFPQELEGLSGRVNVLSGQPLEVEKLSGGLTNTNFKVSTPGGCYVVRLASDNSNLLEIDRESEYVNSVRAAEAGVGAPVIERLDTPNVLVVGFIDGRTLSASDLQHGHLLQRVAGACRQLHGARRFRSDFNMFDVQRRYLELAISRGFRIPDDYQDFEELFVRVRRAMEIAPEPTVPCNNDLLAENFIDDGERVWIIDYEYSGNNEPSFELGNIWSESELSIDQLEVLVRSYYGRADRATMSRCRLWGLASKYGWTLWAAIQANVSTLDFDFWEWGMEKYERAVAEFKGEDFERLLQDVTGGLS
ncbi:MULTISPECIES: choline/ethanolamine kinase family protein [Ferrimicrobium]|uniref:Phosphotransferase n=1 Tax=Ferrimicrobium acidiphilum TaxID=121039 RepID=A0ABV3Y5W8_9ACTN|nr:MULTISPECIES: choline/ethanolamine kinase family protein [Ferrimicrobium]